MTSFKQTINTEHIINKKDIRVTPIEDCIFLHCEILSFSEEKFQEDEYGATNIFPWIILPRSKKQKCFVCGKRFKNYAFATVAVMPDSDGLQHDLIIAHEYCYKLMVMKGYSRFE